MSNESLLSSPMVAKLVNLAIEEDLGLGDITSSLAIPAEMRGEAKIVAREKLIACGLPMVAQVFAAYGSDASVSPQVAEGVELKSGDVMCHIAGSTRDILACERTVLNFLQRLCGVASFTRELVSAAGNLVVLDTRKTMPGWRMLDKYSVTVGGAKNHRIGLGDMVLVKNNHIDAASGTNIKEKMRHALSQVFEGKPFYMPVEVEVRSLEELSFALEFKPTVVMLDNMDDDTVREAATLVKERAPGVLIEVSGGVAGGRLQYLSSIGIDCVSVGALTTQARNVDISLRILGQRPAVGV